MEKQIIDCAYWFSQTMKKQKTNKVKTVVYIIHFILVDIWARNGVWNIFGGKVPKM